MLVNIVKDGQLWEDLHVFLVGEVTKKLRTERESRDRSVKHYFSFLACVLRSIGLLYELIWEWSGSALAYWRTPGYEEQKSVWDDCIRMPYFVTFPPATLKLAVATATNIEK